MIGWEGGKTVPLETLGKLLVLFRVNPSWISLGDGDMFTEDQSDEAIVGTRAARANDGGPLLHPSTSIVPIRPREHILQLAQQIGDVALSIPDAAAPPVPDRLMRLIDMLSRLDDRRLGMAEERVAILLEDQEQESGFGGDQKQTG